MRKTRYVLDSIAEAYDADALLDEAIWYIKTATEEGVMSPATQSALDVALFFAWQARDKYAKLDESAELQAGNTYNT